MSQNLFVNSSYLFNGMPVTSYVDPGNTMVWDGHANNSASGNASPAPTAGLPPSAFMQTPMVFAGSPNPPNATGAYSFTKMNPQANSIQPQNGMFVFVQPAQQAPQQAPMQQMAPQQQMVMLLPTMQTANGNAAMQQSNQNNMMHHSHGNHNSNNNSGVANSVLSTGMTSMVSGRDGKGAESHNVCRHYMVGRCNRRKCRFLHPALDHAGATAAPTTATASSISMQESVPVPALPLHISNPSMLPPGFKETGYDASLNRSSINDISTCSSPMNSKSDMFFSYIPPTADTLLIDACNRKV